MNDNVRPTTYDESSINSGGWNTGKSVPIFLLLLVAGVVGYTTNLGGFRDTNTSTSKEVKTNQTTPTGCPTIYNGPQSIIENGRLRLITPTPHPCQANQSPTNEIIEELEITPTTTITTIPTLGL